MTNPTATKLLPCPFCGGAMEFYKARPSPGCADAVLHVEPFNCGMTEFSISTRDESVIAAWNARAHLRAVPLGQPEQPKPDTFYAASGASSEGASAQPSDSPILNCGKCEDRQECASGCVRHAAAQEAAAGVPVTFPRKGSNPPPPACGKPPPPPNPPPIPGVPGTLQTSEQRRAAAERVVAAARGVPPIVEASDQPVTGGGNVPS